MDVNEMVGKQLRELRREKGISQEELSNKAGFHQAYVNNIETGEENPTVNCVCRLANALDAPLKTLFEVSETTAEQDGVTPLKPE